MHDPDPDQQPNVQPQLNPDPAAVPPAQNIDPLNQLMQMNAALMQQLQLQHQQAREHAQQQAQQFEQRLERQMQQLDVERQRQQLDVERQVQQQVQQFAQARGPHKVQAPDKFYGKPSEDVTQWSFELEQYFNMRHTRDDGDMVSYAITLLRDDASRWYRRTQQHGQNFRQFNALVLKLAVSLSGAEELAHFKRGLNKELRRNVEYQTPVTAKEAQEIAARFARIDEAIDAGGDVQPNRLPPHFDPASVTDVLLSVDAPPDDDSLSSLLVCFAAMKHYWENRDRIRDRQQQCRRAAQTAISRLRQHRLRPPTTTAARPLLFRGLIDGTEVSIMLDSGASSNCVRLDIAESSDDGLDFLMSASQMKRRARKGDAFHLLQVTQLIDAGLVEPASSPWGAPVLARFDLRLLEHPCSPRRPA